MSDERDLLVILFSSNCGGFPLVGRSLYELLNSSKEDPLYVRPENLIINYGKGTWTYKGETFLIGESREIELNGDPVGTTIFAIYPSHLDDKSFGSLVRDIQDESREDLGGILG